MQVAHTSVFLHLSVFILAEHTTAEFNTLNLQQKKCAFKAHFS